LRHRLVRETGPELHDRSPAAWRCKGRCVPIADGTTGSMPDPPANQEAYPQPASQQPGLGFPLARLVVVFSLACGTVLAAAWGRSPGKPTGANSLLRTRADALEAGAVLLADRSFGGWFDRALGRRRGVEVVVRLQQLRRCDLRRGRRLGPGEHGVAWPQPPRPAWMDQATYPALPGELERRAVRVRVRPRGFRTQALVVGTTLRAAVAYAAADRADLYRLRGHAALDRRSRKETLGMGVLRCKAPALVRKEVWAHLLGYNLLRVVMAQAAAACGADPRALRFPGAVPALTVFAERLWEARGKTAEELYAWLRFGSGAHPVGDRPDRVEPRARPRRPQEYPVRTEPRAKARKRPQPRR
jgi:hypothetical protein